MSSFIFQHHNSTVGIHLYSTETQCVNEDKAMIAAMLSDEEKAMVEEEKDQVHRGLVFEVKPVVKKG